MKQNGDYDGRETDRSPPMNPHIHPNTMERHDMKPESILRLPDVLGRTGLSRSTLYARISEGLFPTPIALGRRAVGWLESEIDDWIARRVEASRKNV